MEELKIHKLADVISMHSGYRLDPDGRVRSRVVFGKELQGHDRVVHGGAISFVFDAAMGNCMFAHKLVTVTAELKIRFLKPIMVEDVCEVSSWISRRAGMIRVVQAEIVQNGVLAARAEAKFVVKPEMETEELAQKHKFYEQSEGDI